MSNRCFNINGVDLSDFREKRELVEVLEQALARIAALEEELAKLKEQAHEP